MTASNSTGRIRFAPGQIVITANAAGLLAPDEVASALARHLTGDWGTVCADDAEANEEALIHGDRLMSVYGQAKRRFWIITEADRSVTTILMPEDY
ncbi:MAG: hypothetical protein KF774_06990 [Planctomyces sp.]|nr:hypothetical protein [Planctomyces sp.]